MEQSCLELVQKAQDGDNSAREVLLQRSTKFILKVASQSCRRYLDWANDDELSISMMAFNEAIDSYDQSKASSFFSYARMVIQRRLIDYFRKENKHFTIAPLDDDAADSISIEDKFSFNEFIKELETWERKKEIEIWSEKLREFEISFELLTKKSPSHKSTRDELLKVAQFLVEKEPLFSHLIEKKRLPQKELAQETGCSLKLLERGRIFIIAMVMVLSHPELVYLRSYLKCLPEKKRGGNNHE